MSTQALTLPKSFPVNLRPFDIRRDLSAVADLVELCFADSLDADGRLYIRQMRQAARGGPLMELAAAGSRRVDLPMSGYVWIQDEHLVGNLSLVPHRHRGRWLYLIANVAVHPDYRRHGIALALTQAALQEVQERGRHETWLQVDEDNAAAVDLYLQMGFTERMRRTSWRAHMQSVPDLMQGKISIEPPRVEDWSTQQAWLEVNFPPEMRWQLPLDVKLLRPGWRGTLERAFSERQIHQWAAFQNEQLLGVLSWQSSVLEADRLWLAATAEDEDEAIPALMSKAYAELFAARPLALNYPAGRAVNALQAAGFHAVRTLIWMDYPWS